MDGFERITGREHDGLVEKCQENGWLKVGGFDWQDDPFLEEYPYEFSRTDSVDRLREALGSGNWAIRQGFCYRDLAFIQQVNGGDEWWTLKRDGDAWTGFERTIAVTRSRNIAVSMIAQSLSQLKETYGDNNAETIVNACDTLLYLGGKANETNEEISKMAGKQTVASETQSDSRGAGWTRTVNRGISERDLIQPAEVARMPREDALVLVNGCMPLMDRKYRLERHPRSRLLEEATRRGPFDFAEYRRRKDGAS